MKQEREEAYVALQCAASFHCLVEGWTYCEELRPRPKAKWSFVDKRRERMKHRTEWCAEADRYRCMRCGRESKDMKMSGKCTGPNLLSSRLGKWRSRHLGGHDLVRRMDRQGVVFIWRRKCSGYARQRMGSKLMNCCGPEQKDTKEFGKMVKRIQILEFEMEGSMHKKACGTWQRRKSYERRWPKDFRSILARRRRIICCQLGQMGSAAENLSRLGKKVSRHES